MEERDTHPHNGGTVASGNRLQGWAELLGGHELLLEKGRGGVSTLLALELLKATLLETALLKTALLDRGGSGVGGLGSLDGVYGGGRYDLFHC